MLSELKDEQETMEGVGYMCVYTGTRRIFPDRRGKACHLLQRSRRTECGGGRGRECEECSAEGTMGQGPQPPGRSERYQPRVRLVENGVMRAITGVKYKRN